MLNTFLRWRSPSLSCYYTSINGDGSMPTVKSFFLNSELKVFLVCYAERQLKIFQRVCFKIGSPFSSLFIFVSTTALGPRRPGRLEAPSRSRLVRLSCGALNGYYPNGFITMGKVIINQRQTCTRTVAMFSRLDPCLSWTVVDN